MAPPPHVCLGRGSKRSDSANGPRIGRRHSYRERAAEQREHGDVLSDSLRKPVDFCDGFAGVNPEHKLPIVHVSKSRGWPTGATTEEMMRLRWRRQRGC